MNFLDPSFHKNPSELFRKTPLIVSPVNITPELATELLKFVSPVTLANMDQQSQT